MHSQETTQRELEEKIRSGYDSLKSRLERKHLEFSGAIEEFAPLLSDYGERSGIVKYNIYDYSLFRYGSDKHIQTIQKRAKYIKENLDEIADIECEINLMQLRNWNRFLDRIRYIVSALNN